MKMELRLKSNSHGQSDVDTEEDLRDLNLQDPISLRRGGRSEQFYFQFISFSYFSDCQIFF